MNFWNKKLIREQIEKKLNFLRNYADLGAPENGWIKALREALGMTTRQMADKTGIDQSRISRLEHAEKSGNLRLASLQKIAKGMGMRFVYGFVPDVTLEEMVRRQAEKIALQRMKRLEDTMALELQRLSPKEHQKALNDMIDKILIDDPKDFWDDGKI